MASDVHTRTPETSRGGRRSLVVAGLSTVWAACSMFASKRGGGATALTPPDDTVSQVRACGQVAQLRHFQGAPGDVVLVTGFADPSDLGGGMFVWADGEGAADDGGICIVPTDARRTGSWQRVVSGPMNVRWFGARGDGTTNDDAAFKLATKAARSRGKAVYAPAGRYRIEKLDGLDGGYTFSGDGPMSTMLCGSDEDHVIEIAKRSLNRLTLRDFSIHGGYSFTPNPKVELAKSHHGIYFHGNHFAFGVTIANVHVAACSGSGICDEDGMFSSSFQGITVDRCGGHGIDILGSCSISLVNCYVENLAQHKAAYRIGRGTPVLIGCNGINNNDGIAEDTTWGAFGTGETGPCWPTFLGCNVEGFTGVGCSFGRGSFANFFGTGFVPGNPRRALALRYAHVPHESQVGIWDGTSSIYDPPQGGAWGSREAGAHGHPIESVGNPFIALNKYVADRGSFDRNGANTYLTTIPSVTSTRSAYLKCSLDLSSAVIRDVHLPPSNRGNTR